MDNRRFSIAMLAVAATLTAAVWPVAPAYAQAQRNTLDAIGKTVTAAEIAEALRPKDLRNLGPAAPKENSAIVALTFETGSAELTDQSKLKLREFGKAFKEFIPGVAIVIEGHADPRGGPELNLDLSRRRAAAVREYLVAELGDNPKQFEVVGLGETRLKDPANPNAEINRRVEFVTKNIR